MVLIFTPWTPLGMNAVSSCPFDPGGRSHGDDQPEDRRSDPEVAQGGDEVVCAGRVSCDGPEDRDTEGRPRLAGGVVDAAGGAVAGGEPSGEQREDRERDEQTSDASPIVPRTRPPRSRSRLRRPGVAVTQTIAD